jgi:phage terminase large subunit
MGVSYMVLYVFLWRFLFKKGENFLIGSRKEDYVDTAGDLSSLFEKLRYCLDRLPYWMTPVGWNKKKHSTYMKLINPENGSAIVGEATNKDFARGGRQKAVLFDELEAWEMAEEAWRSASDSTPCKFAVGTPKGEGGKFAELHRGDEVKKKHHLMWYLHPNKVGTSSQHLKRL